MSFKEDLAQPNKEVVGDRTPEEELRGLSLHQQHNSFDTESVTTATNMTHTDMGSWVDDDDCFYESLNADLAKAKSEAEAQAQKATWKEVRGSQHYSSAYKGGEGNSSNNKRRGDGGKHSHRGGRKNSSQQGDKKPATSVFNPPQPSGGRFDALAPSAPRRR